MICVKDVLIIYAFEKRNVRRQNFLKHTNNDGTSDKEALHSPAVVASF